MKLRQILAATIACLFTLNLTSSGATKSATYTVASKTSVTVSGTTPDGSSAAYSQTYANAAGQATSGNSMTLTLSGYTGKTITGLTLSMKSNSGKGSGSLSATCGSDTLASIATSAFNSGNWYDNAYHTSYVNVTPAVTSTTVGAGENIVITIAATVNSLYCESFTIQYTTGSSPSPTTLSAPTGLALFGAAASDSFTVTWSAVANASGYTATLLDSTGTTELVTVSCGPSATTASFSGLNPSTTYTVHVVAKGDGVTYSDSDPAEDTFNTVASGPALSAPTNLGFSNTTPVSTTLSWTGDSNATGYQLVIIEGTEIGDLHNVTLTETFASATYSPNSSATSYSNRTINDGNLGTWTATQCRSDNAGGPTIRAEGTLTSPEISGSVSAVEFDYTWPYGDSGNVDIDLYAGSTKVGTSTITASQGTSGTATYSNLSIDGPTTLEFRNTAGSNKRMTVTAVRIFCPVNVVIEDTIGPVTTYTAEGLSPSTTYSFVVSAVATNAQGTVVSTSAAASDTVTTRSNAAPTLSTTPAGSASALTGHELSVTLTAADSDNDAVTLSVSPANLGTLSGITFTWTPAANASGTQNFTFTATDPYGASATADLAVTVTANHSPVLSSGHVNDTIGILEGQTASATITATDDDGDTVTMTLDSFTGSGASFNADTGAFSWTAPVSSAGTYTAVFSAGDGFGGTDTLTLTIDVTSADANRAPEVTVLPTSISINVRDTATASISAEDANEGDTVTLAMSSETIPAAAFNPATGAFSWTPAAAGTYTATFTATDDADDPLTSDPVTLTVIVTNGAPTILLSDSIVSCKAGEQVEIEVVAADLFIAPRLTVSDGTLGEATSDLDGAVYTITNTWSWTPTTPGTHTVTFTAADADDSTLTSTATLTVTVGLAAPTLSVSEPPTTSSAVLTGSAVTGADGYLVTYSGVATNTATFYDIDFETFSGNNHALGNASYPFDTYLPGTGWTGEVCYMRDSIDSESGGTYAIQIGSSSASGYLQTPAFSDVFPGGKLYLSLNFKALDSAYVVFRTVTMDGVVRDSLMIGSDQNRIEANSVRQFNLETIGYGLTVQPGDSLRIVSGNRRILVDNLKVWGTQSTVADAEKTVGFASFPVTLTGLESRTVYTATAVATNGTTASPASNAVQFETFGLYDPANLAFSGTTHNSTTLSWDAVANAQSYRVSASYKVTGSPVVEEMFDSCVSDKEPFGDAESAAMDSNPIAGWTLTLAYPAKGCVKVGSSKNAGSATTPAFNAAGDYTLTFKAAPWNTEANKTLQLAVTGGGALDVTSVSLVAGQWTEYTATITGATAATRLTFSASNRFFLDDVVVIGETSVTAIHDVTVSASATPSYTATGLSPETTYTFTVTAVTTVDNEEITSSASADETTLPVPPSPPTALILF